MSQFDDYAKKVPDTLCMYPFSHVNFKFDGKASCCFRSSPVVDLKKDSDQEDIWNSEGFRTLRQQLLKGEKAAACENCWKLEEGGGFSYRQESIRDKVIHSQWRSALDHYDPATGAVMTGPAQVEVRLSNLCGLTCRMCSPEYSSKWASLRNQNPELGRWAKPNDQKQSPEHEKTILDFLEKHKQSLRYVMFSGGEPLLQKAHYQALKALAPYEHQMTVEYTSNLNTLRAEENSVLDYWPQFRRIRMKISLDADREIYPYVRAGGSIDKVEQNIRTLQERFPSENRLDPVNNFPDDHVIIIATCTVSLYNIFRLPEIARYFTSQGLIFHTSQVQKPYYQSTQALPLAVKREITEKLENFLGRIEQELADTWEGQRLWAHPKSRETQKYRVDKFIRNSLSFMNARDRSSEFPELLAFESAFAKASGTKQFTDLYPQWKNHV